MVKIVLNISLKYHGSGDSRILLKFLKCLAKFTSIVVFYVVHYFFYNKVLIHLKRHHSLVTLSELSHFMKSSALPRA